MIKYLVLYIESASQYSTRKQAIRYRKCTAIIQSASQYAVQIGEGWVGGIMEEVA